MKPYVLISYLLIRLFNCSVSVSMSGFFNEDDDLDGSYKNN